MVSRSHPLLASLRPALPALVLVLALATAGSVAGQEDNPFARPVPAGAAPAPAASPLDTLELRGVMTLGDTTIITLFDTASSKSTVVQLGGTANGLTVSDFQSSDDSVLVQSAGRERRVKIRKAQIITMVAPPPVPVPQPGTPQVAGGQPPPTPSPAGAVGDEEVRQRMQRVAEEIRRRREMRREIMERSAQQQQPGQSPP